MIKSGIPLSELYINVFIGGKKTNIESGWHVSRIAIVKYTQSQKSIKYKVVGSRNDSKKPATLYVPEGKEP